MVDREKFEQNGPQIVSMLMYSVITRLETRLQFKLQKDLIPDLLVRTRTDSEDCRLIIDIMLSYPNTNGLWQIRFALLESMQVVPLSPICAALEEYFEPRCFLAAKIANNG